MYFSPVVPSTVLKCNDVFQSISSSVQSDMIFKLVIDKESEEQRYREI